MPFDKDAANDPPSTSNNTPRIIARRRYTIATTDRLAITSVLARALHIIDSIPLDFNAQRLVAVEEVDVQRRARFEEEDELTEIKVDVKPTLSRDDMTEEEAQAYWWLDGKDGKRIQYPRS